MARFRLLARPNPAPPPGLPRPARRRSTPASGGPATGCRPSGSSPSRYGCSLITVRRALGDLAREQRLERTRGRGTFVTRPPIDLELDGTMSFTDEVQQLGHDAVDPDGHCPDDPGRATPSRTRWTIAVGASGRPPRAAADGRRRAAAPGAGVPARGPVPGPARERPRARFAVRAPRPIATTRACARAREALEPIALPAREARLLGVAATPAGAADRGARLRPGRAAGGVRPFLRPGRPDALLRGAGRCPLQPEGPAAAPVGV